MFFTKLVQRSTILLALAMPISAEALTRQQAEVCVTALLQAFETKKAPLHLLSLDRMFTNIFDRYERSRMTRDQEKAARKVLVDTIRDAFSTSKNQFSNIRINEVGSSKVTVVVDIFWSSEGKSLSNEIVSAFVTGENGCGIREVRVESVGYTITSYLRAQMLADTRMAFMR